MPARNFNRAAPAVINEAGQVKCRYCGRGVSHQDAVVNVERRPTYRGRGSANVIFPPCCNRCMYTFVNSWEAYHVYRETEEPYPALSESVTA